MSVPEVAALHDAARRGDVSAVRGLLRKGVTANSRAHTHRCRDPNGCTALQVAVRAGQLEVALILLKAGADVNGLEGGQVDDDPSDRDPSPLHEAAMFGDSELTKALLNAGAETDPIANVEAVDTLYNIDANGYGTPLLYAAELGNVEVARILVEAGADVISDDGFGRTPLHRAARSGEAALVRILMDAGADIDAQDDWGFTPLHTASSRAFVEALLAAGANPNVVSEGVDFVFRCTPIGMYCTSKAKDKTIAIVDALLRHGVDTSIPVYICGDPAGSLVSCAVQRGQPGLVSRLLDAGLDPNDADLEPNEDVDEGMLPIHIAAICGNADVVRVLLQRGADKEARTENTGSSPLHLACRWANLECVRELLRWNVSLTQRDSGTGDSGSLPEDVIGKRYHVRCCRSSAGRNRPSVPGADDPEAIRRALEEAAAWWRRGPVILLRKRLIKQPAEPSAPVFTITEARISGAGIKGGGGSGDGFTLNEEAGRGVRDSDTTGIGAVRVGDGSNDVQQAREAGHICDKSALRGVLERLVTLGGEEDGVFRNIMMFV